MKKTSLYFVLLCTSWLVSPAQLKQLAEGPSFPEPEDGFGRIMQMKNGNTIYLHISVSDGILVRIYDPGHIEKVSTSSTPSYGKLKWKELLTGDRTEWVDGVIEVNNDVLIFISTITGVGKASTYKLLIDGNTGKIKEDMIITNSWGVRVIKDYINDHYAILYRPANAQANDDARVINVFGSDHKVIRTIPVDNLPVLDADHPNTGIIDMVMANDKVYALFSAYNYSKKRPSNMPVPETHFIGISESGTSFSKDIVLLKLPPDMPVWGTAVRYNPATRKIYIFSMKNNYWENYKRSYQYYMYVSIFDPETRNMQTFDEMGTNEKINNAYQERFSKKDDYLGMAQNLFVNDDGSFSLLCEERMMGGADGNNTWIGKVLQSNYDKDGQFRSGYIVPKFHHLFRVAQKPFSRKGWENSAQPLYFGVQYKFFLYLDGAENKYLLYNDLERNNKVKGDRYAAVAGVEDCDTYIYKLTGDELVPPKLYAFGEPASGEHNIAMLSVSDYDKKKNVLATLRLDAGSKKNKTVKLVWLQPQ